MTLVVADLGVGKSTLLTWMAAKVSSGDPWEVGGEQRPPAGVLSINYDENISTDVRPRLDHWGADCGKIILFEDVMEDGKAKLFRIPEHLPLIEDALNELRDVTLFSIDPLEWAIAVPSPGLNLRGMGSDGASTVSPEARMEGLLEPLIYLASSRRISVVCACWQASDLIGNQPSEFDWFVRRMS